MVRCLNAFINPTTINQRTFSPFNISPVLYSTVWRWTWHLIACSDESWFSYVLYKLQISINRSKYIPPIDFSLVICRALWRTWHLIACSGEIWFKYQFSLTYVRHQKAWELNGYLCSLQLACFMFIIDNYFCSKQSQKIDDHVITIFRELTHQ